MNSLGLQVRWQVDNLNGLEWALLDANTTTDTKGLVDGGNFIRGGDLKFLFQF